MGRGVARPLAARAPMEPSKAWLLRPNEQGVSVYSHLTDVLATMLDENVQPADALDAFESISKSVKAKAFTAASATAPPAPTSAPDADATSAWQQGASELLKPARGEDEEIDEEAGEIGDRDVGNLPMQMELMAWAGVGISAEDAYRVHLSIIKLANGTGLSSARFFGKILGTGADYYVVEAKLDDDGEGPDEPADPPEVPAEERGTGCNACVYFVTNDPAAPWVQLPDVTPAQLSAAASIRKYVTGDLAAPVRAYPVFPGAEKEYVRALIARVTHATILCPADKFKLEGDDGETKTVVEVDREDEEAPPPLPPAAMVKHASWVKYYMGILKIGRTTNLDREMEEDDDGNEVPVGPEPEPELQALAPIEPAEWSVTMVPRLGGAPVAVARSLRWAGAYAACITKEEVFVNMYFGYGHDALDGPFMPAPPPPIMQDPDDLTEEDDPPLEEENEAVRAEQIEKLKEGGDGEE